MFAFGFKALGKQRRRHAAAKWFFRVPGGSLLPSSQNINPLLLKSFGINNGAETVNKHLIPSLFNSISCSFTRKQTSKKSPRLLQVFNSAPVKLSESSTRRVCGLRATQRNKPFRPFVSFSPAASRSDEEIPCLPRGSWPVALTYLKQNTRQGLFWPFHTS